jgi:hypothetical protein
MLRGIANKSEEVSKTMTLWVERSTKGTLLKDRKARTAGCSFLGSLSASKHWKWTYLRLGDIPDHLKSRREK